MGKTLTIAVSVANASSRPLRAVDYLRVSTEEQAKGHGITYTGKNTARHIKKKGWEHVGTYADEGLSGSLEAQDRPDLARLMRDAHSTPRPFDMVVVNEGRVIGRTGPAFWRWVWDLEALGVYVAVVDGDFDNSTAEGRARMRDAASYAEKERELIRTRTQGGIQEAAEDGMYPGGNVPFGWKIKKGRYVVDKRQADTLRRGYEVYTAKRSWQAVALTWNAENRLTASGKRWTRKNARRVMLSEATLNNRVIWRGKNALCGLDGSLLYGEQTVIKLPKIFKKKEAEVLKEAASSPRRRAPAQGRVYLLSGGRLLSPCGQAYIGHNHREGVYSYQCKGRQEKYAGAGGKCDCPPLDVDAVEASVWGDTVAILGDAERMKALAQEWIDSTQAEQVDHASRIARFDQQIAEQNQVLNVTMAVAARQAAQRGLDEAASEVAVEAAVKPLMTDLADLEKLRAEAIAWQREAEQVTRRAREFERLAEAARKNLEGFTPEQRADLFDALEVEATVVRCAPKRQGVACKVTDWFTARGRDVPDLTDAAWEIVEPLLKGRSDAAPKRPVLEALLRKAVTGERFQDLGEYGNPRTLQTQSNRWLTSGAWDAAMELLKDRPGRPAWRPDPIDIKVTLVPQLTEFSIGDGEDDGWGVDPKSAVQLTFMTAA